MTDKIEQQNGAESLAGRVPQTTQPARHHSLERTSPKGPGQRFMGRCTLCGKTDLRMQAVFEYCENPMALTPDEVVLEAIRG